MTKPLINQNNMYPSVLYLDSIASTSASENYEQYSLGNFTIY